MNRFLSSQQLNDWRAIDQSSSSDASARARAPRRPSPAGCLSRSRPESLSRGTPRLFEIRSTRQLYPLQRLVSCSRASSEISFWPSRCVFIVASSRRPLYRDGASPPAVTDERAATAGPELISSNGQIYYLKRGGRCSARRAARRANVCVCISALRLIAPTDRPTSDNGRPRRKSSDRMDGRN